MKKQTNTLALAGLLAGLCGTALAQTVPATPDATTTPAPGMTPAPNPSVNSTDQTYLTQNAQGSVSDFATAETGVQKAQDKNVRSYAAQVMKDHSQLNMDVLNLAHDKNLTLPVTISDEDKTKLDTLTALNGADFDKAFLQEEVQVNTEDVKDARAELTATSDPDVHKFVSKFLDTEQKHLDRAQDLLNKMSTTSK